MNGCHYLVKSMYVTVKLSHKDAINVVDVTEYITLSNQALSQVSKSIKAAQHTIISEVKPQLTKSQFISFN